MIKRMTIANIVATILANTAVVGDAPTVGEEFSKLAEILHCAGEERVIEVEMRHLAWHDLDFDNIHPMRAFRFGGIEVQLDEEDASLYSIIPGTNGVRRWEDWDQPVEWLAKLV